MISSSEQYHIAIQLEPDWQKPLTVRSHRRRDYKEIPPRFTDEEIAERIAWDNDTERRRAAAEAEEEGRV